MSVATTAIQELIDEMDKEGAPLGLHWPVHLFASRRAAYVLAMARVRSAEDAALAEHGDTKLYRTAVYVDHVGSQIVRCTPAGVDLPPGSAVVLVDEFPAELRDTLAVGKVFFARVNLNATSTAELVIGEIEPRWA